MTDTQEGIEKLLAAERKRCLAQERRRFAGYLHAAREVWPRSSVYGAVNEALDKLSEENPLQAKIVEMRIFGGLTVDEVAEALSLSKRTVERHWTVIRAWLRRELEGEV